MNYRQQEIMSALDWIRMARDLALTIQDYRSEALVSRLDYAKDRICSALDIQPSVEAIETIVHGEPENGG